MKSLSFNRMELAGSLGDLGTFLPLGIGLIVLNGMSATSILFTAGLFYILAGTYFRIPVAVQPMKAIATYAIATSLSPVEIASAGLWMGGGLLLLGITGTMERIGKWVPRNVVRGIQLALGVVLFVKGLELMVEPDDFQFVQSLGPIPIGAVLGIAGTVVTLLWASSARFPAALVLIVGGVVAGLLLGKPFVPNRFQPGLHFPFPLPYGFPDWSTFLSVLPLAVLPQIPMTVGNAVISNTDLSKSYFGDSASRMTHRAGAISQGLANLGSFALGGMPLCHGAGGLAAHYRFGARTAGSNFIIGGTFLALSLFLGESLVGILNWVPLAVLGVLLAFSGLQLAMMVQDLSNRKDLFVALSILGVTLASNLAVGFGVGLGVAYLLRWKKIQF